MPKPWEETASRPESPVEIRRDESFGTRNERSTIGPPLAQKLLFSGNKFIDDRFKLRERIGAFERHAINQESRSS